MKPWNHEEAGSLKAQGLGFREIGEAFGVSYYLARSKLDPVWLIKRRAKINANRVPVRSLGKREHVHHIKPESIKVDERDDVPFMTASGIMAYRKHVPNRTSLTSQPVYEATATKAVSLPWVSILGPRAALVSKEGRG